MQDSDENEDLLVASGSGPIGETYRNISPDRYVVFSASFENWEPNNFHWNVPSNISIFHDGEWIIYSDHLAHQRPSAGRRRFLVSCRFFPSQGGPLLHANEYVLASLTHRQQRWNVTRQGHDPILEERLPSIRWWEWQQWIKR